MTFRGPAVLKAVNRRSAITDNLFSNSDVACGYLVDVCLWGNDFCE